MLWRVENQGTQLTNELEQLVHLETQEAYIGARKTTQRWQQEKEMWVGNINELIVGVMISLLTPNVESGFTFWISKVIKIVKEINASIELMFTSTKQLTKRQSIIGTTRMWSRWLRRRKREAKTTYQQSKLGGCRNFCLWVHLEEVWSSSSTNHVSFDGKS